MTDQTLAKLRELLLNEFTEAELEQICRDIGLDYASLPGAGAFGKTRELVESVRTQDKLRQLQNRMRELRPGAYANANIQITDAATVSATSSASSRGVSWLPILAIGLVVVLCVAAGAALLLNRPGQATAPVAAATSMPTTQAPLAVAEPTQATTTDSSTASQITETQSAQVATDLPATVTAATATSLPTPIPTPGPSATPNANESHPAALVIRDLNQQLPQFYLGKATANDLQTYWTGDAWRSVVNFGTTKLPRVMRVPPASRGNLDVTYSYDTVPALVSERGGTIIVNARETWRYANAANAIEICEMRDYVYTMINDGGKFKVREFTSKLLKSGC